MAEYEIRDRFEWSRLIDLYGELLPKKQREFLQLHCNEDLSLSEIAESNGVSRQAIHDAVKKGKQSLEKYEKHLGLLAGCAGKGDNWLEKSLKLISQVQEDLGEIPLYDNSGALARLEELSSLLKEVGG